MRYLLPEVSEEINSCDDGDNYEFRLYASCDGCEDNFLTTDLIYHDGKRYCPECAKANDLIVCDYCGECRPKEEMKICGDNNYCIPTKCWCKSVWHQLSILEDQREIDCAADVQRQLKLLEDLR